MIYNDPQKCDSCGEEMNMFGEWETTKDEIASLWVCPKCTAKTYKIHSKPVVSTSHERIVAMGLLGGMF